MAKKIRIVLTLQLPAGKATPAPPVGTALGPARHQHRRVHEDLQREDRRQGRPDHPGPDHGLRGPLVHVRPQDPARRGPAPQGGRHREGLGHAAKRETVGRVTRDQVREIAAIKMADLSANDIEAAARMIEGTARSMGIEVAG